MNPMTQDTDRTKQCTQDSWNANSKAGRYNKDSQHNWCEGGSQSENKLGDQYQERA